MKKIVSVILKKFLGMMATFAVVYVILVPIGAFCTEFGLFDPNLYRQNIIVAPLLAIPLSIVLFLPERVQNIFEKGLLVCMSTVPSLMAATFMVMMIWGFQIFEGFERNICGAFAIVALVGLIFTLRLIKQAVMIPLANFPASKPIM